MKKAIGIIFLAILFTSCGAENQENQNATWSLVQSGSVVENSQSGSQTEENQNNTKTGSEVEEEKNDFESSDTQKDSSQEYGFSTIASGSIKIETQTWSEVDTKIELSDEQDEQLIQETMDELNEFFELLENTDG